MFVNHIDCVVTFVFHHLPKHMFTFLPLFVCLCCFQIFAYVFLCSLCFFFSLFRCYVYDTVLFVSSFSHLFVVCFVPCNNVADHTMRHGTCLTFCLFPVFFFLYYFVLNLTHAFLSAYMPASLYTVTQIRCVWFVYVPTDCRSVGFCSNKRCPKKQAT